MTWLALIVGLACVPIFDPVTRDWLRERWRARRIESEANRVRRRRAEAKAAARLGHDDRLPRPWLSTRSLSSPGLSASKDEMRKRHAAFVRGPAEGEAYMRRRLPPKSGVYRPSRSVDPRTVRPPPGPSAVRPAPNPTRPYTIFGG